MKFLSLSIFEVSIQDFFFDNNIATASATLLKIGVGVLLAASCGKSAASFLSSVLR